MVPIYTKLLSSWTIIIAFIREDICDELPHGGDEGDGELGLNAHHEHELTSYLRFCRRQRNERLRSIDANFDDVISSRLMEETYTREEVEDLLKNLSEIVGNEIETELLHNTHSNSVLVTALFSQAQKWHLELNADTAQLENQEKLAVIKQFESSGPRTGTSPPKKLNQLAPLQGEKTGPTSLLEAHIEKLKQENFELLNHMKELETKVVAMTLQKETMQLDQSATAKEINHLKNTLVSKPKEEELFQLNDEIAGMKLQLSETHEKSKEEQDKLMRNLSVTETSLKQIQSQLALAEKELEKKFSQTGAYQNLKKMLSKKNSQLRQLRKRLEKYEPADEEARIDDD